MVYKMNKEDLLEKKVNEILGEKQERLFNIIVNIIWGFMSIAAAFAFTFMGIILTPNLVNLNPGATILNLYSLGVVGGSIFFISNGLKHLLNLTEDIFNNQLKKEVT